MRTKAASLIMGTRMRLTANSGASLTAMGSLPSLRDSSMVRSKVSSSVSKPRITSTSFITGTGLKKCIPTTFCGRPVAAAISVILNPEVFEARIVPLLQTASSFLYNSFLRSIFSTTASMTKSTPLKSSMLVVPLMRLRTASASSRLFFPLSTARCKFFSTAVNPRCTNFSSRSLMITWKPASAATWAIPLPMVPAPAIPIIFVSMCSLPNRFFANIAVFLWLRKTRMAAARETPLYFPTKTGGRFSRKARAPSF